MPKIDAPSVEEHIRQQTEVLLNTASKLFREQGYLSTDMGDIAKEMGLKRNSLYRYYPNKDHILMACIRRELEPHIEQEKALADKYDDPHELLDKVMDLQIDFVTTRDHTSLAFMEEVRRASPELREEAWALHEQFQSVLSHAISSILKGSKRDAEHVTFLVISMIEASSKYILRRGKKNKVKQELKESVNQLLGSA